MRNLMIEYWTEQFRRWRKSQTSTKLNNINAIIVRVNVKAYGVVI